MRRRKRAFVLDAAVLDADAVEPLAVALRRASRGAASKPRDRRPACGSASGAAEVVAQHLAELLDAPVVDHVLDAGPLAVGAVAVVAEQLDDRLGRRARTCVGRDVADRLGQVRERVGVAVRHAHAAADQHVVADDLAVLDDGEEAEVLGVDVDAVVFGQGEAGLELARQVDLAVDRLDRRRRRLGSSTGLPLSQIS